METFIDHLASLAGKSPLDVKRGLLTEHPRYLTVLDAVVKNSDWGKPIEDGWGRGLAVSEFARSVVAQVVEAGIVNDEIVVRHVTCAVDCGLVVNPDVVRAQQSGIIYGLSMMTEKIEIVDGVVQQRNFDTFPMMRMNRTPKIHSIIVPCKNKPSLRRGEVECASCECGCIECDLCSNRGSFNSRCPCRMLGMSMCPPSQVRQKRIVRCPNDQGIYLGSRATLEYRSSGRSNNHE